MASRSLGRLRCAVLVSLLSLAAASCGGIKNKKPTFPVTGKVMAQSQPAAGAKLFFRPADGKDAPEEWTLGFPRATVEADGTFTVETYYPKDGAPVGDYIVLASWPPPLADENEERKPAANDENPFADDRLGGYYMDPALTPLRAKVEAKPNQLPTFELVPGVARPRAPSRSDE